MNSTAASITTEPSSPMTTATKVVTTTTALPTTTEIETTLKTTAAPLSSTEAVTEPPSDDSSMVGPVVGGCFGGVVFIVIIVLLVLFFMRRHKLKQRKKNSRPPPMAPSREQLDPHAEKQPDQPPAPDSPGPGTKGLQIYANVDENNVPSEATDPSLDLDGYLKKSNVGKQKKPRKKEKTGRNHKQKQPTMEHDSVEEAELQPYKNVEFHSKKQGKHVARGISIPEESAPGIPGNMSDGKYVNGKVQSSHQKHGNLDGRVNESDPGEITTDDVSKLGKNNDEDALLDYENVPTANGKKLTLEDLTNYQNVEKSGQVSEADISLTLEPDDVYENP